MVEAGEELVNPATGLRTVFRETARTTSGELLQVDWIGQPRWTTGPDHLHPYQEERFEVLSGTLGLRVAGAERRYGPGDAVIVLAGVPHAAWNAGEDDVHVLVDFRPALRTEVAFETLAGLARDGKTTAAGVPRNPLRLALVLRAFEKEIRFVRPPMAVQKAVLGPLAAVGRLLGYGAEYPYRDDGLRRSSRSASSTGRQTGRRQRGVTAGVEAEPRQPEAEIARSRGDVSNEKHVQE
jgi:quercetin dioxygenase-like cupin family protein